MEMLEKVELVREKANVSYQDAKEALEACGYDVLDAIIWLENAGKADNQTASYETVGASTAEASPEMRQAQQEYHENSKKRKGREAWNSFRSGARGVLNEGWRLTFIAERNGEQVVSIPLLLVIIGLFVWGASLWLLIVGLFFGFRYRIEGAEPMTFDVNDAMNKAADTAQNIKDEFQKDE